MKLRTAAGWARPPAIPFATLALALALLARDRSACDAAGAKASSDLAAAGASVGHFRGRVFHDKNGDGLPSPGEEGVRDAWVVATPSGVGSTRISGVTDGDGSFDLAVPVDGGAYTIAFLAPPGTFPTSTTRHERRATGAGTIAGLDFGIQRFQPITLSASRVLSLASGDLAERDWTGDRTTDARRDADLVLGADAAATDQVSGWFNQYDSNVLFANTRSFARTAPNAVLAMAVDSMPRSTASWGGARCLVTGTTLAGAGNVFVWPAQRTRGNEGYLPNSYSLSFKTLDEGDVQAVATSHPDHSALEIVVGTRSRTPGRGTLEVWRAGASLLEFTRVETFSRVDAIPGGDLGEVTSLRSHDLRGRGIQDLVVGTRTGEATGQLLIFGARRAMAGSARDRRPPGSGLRLSQIETSVGAVVSLACLDYDLDGKVDVVAGVQTGFASGELQFWKNQSPDGLPDSVRFVRDVTVAVDGIPVSLAGADLGGTAHPDLAMGYRRDASSYQGGVRIYYLDGGRVPLASVDPSGGTITGAVPALAIDDFNRGNATRRPSLSRLDLAVAVRTGPASGALVVLIR